ncbi:MBL fold metallo-hydrolase [Sphingomonas daechungensis]|uniref:MBL fold metallo-hydrolase n=1 Tax=Sphingomonas daechungensis TaxID=1176646 RepID=A0ABX6SZZ8_9SPHN|nr:MBL fold metallo-hydrolase [Sphingomonas daechungensis]QNP43030.1 MBL fold metallo-hydrolase [Sphingomonas daechungensis]
MSVDAPYELLEALEPGIARVLAHNPSAFTYYGTQTYLIGEEEVAVVDPGPDLPEHIEALLRAIGDRRIAAIMCTHTHRDHSPAARPLADATGALIVGCAPLALESVGPRADAAFDGDYSPHRVLEDGEAIEVDGRAVTAVATPGHTSNHLCFAVGDALLTGDHVMGWSTTVVVPPDGDMAAYMASLDKLRQRHDRVFYPAHGPPVPNPQRYVRSLMIHRMQRENQILRLVAEQPRDVPDIVANAYPGLDSRLVAAAGGSVLAHLVDLEKRALVVREGETWSKAA